jgi:NAD(P)-dependent dehydrogenase (short-subunit alcohol dehydrogenase family)
MADSLDGKVAIVTGGGSGIGEALSVELARRGARVTVADIRKDDAERVAALIVANGGNAQAQAVDVAIEQDVRSLIEETAATYGRLDYVFNNAGIAIGGEARDLTIDQWRQVLDVNLYGVLYGTFAAYPIMVKQGYGSIVNTASAAGLVPLPMVGAYTTAKHAVVGFSRALRLEAAPETGKLSSSLPRSAGCGACTSSSQTWSTAVCCTASARRESCGSSREQAVFAGPAMPDVVPRDLSGSIKCWSGFSTG